MKFTGKFVLLLIVLWLALSGGLLAVDSPQAPLPEPVSNNAVAILKVHGQVELFSLMGLGAKKTWDSVSNEAYSIDADSGKAYTIHSVPGTAGRIGSVATGAAEYLFLFGGYVLYQGGGMAVPDLGIYEPAADRWLRGTDMPIAVGDSVIGVYRDRYIYLVGGRSNHGAVADVQVYDVEKSFWTQATPIPDAVFGHAGALVGNTIIVVGGAQKDPAGDSPRVVASTDCWQGKIDRRDFRRIEWKKLPAHPGSAQFRIAAGGSEKDQKIYFSGGTDNPYDFNGIGYDGKPAEPSPVTFAFNLRTSTWETLDENTPSPTMDHRGLLVTKEGLVIIGGMEKGQLVTAKVELLSKQAKAK
jgi:N-acetylneuraminic acid mutarotase